MRTVMKAIISVRRYLPHTIVKYKKGCDRGGIAFFSSEILEMAKELERRGIDFYNRLAQLTSLPQHEKFFLLKRRRKKAPGIFTNLQKELNESQEILFYY